MSVVTTYLEQTAPADLRPARTPGPAPRIELVGERSPEFNRFLYTTVGADWRWTDRLPWWVEEWDAWLAVPGRETWVMWVSGAPAGYVELDPRPGADGSHVEIAYFGLLPRFFGRGLGGHLLATVTGHAWRLAERWPRFAPVSRVWVHTCTLDGPYALANYHARGFRTVRVEETE